MLKTILVMLGLLVVVVLMLSVRLWIKGAEPRGTCSSNNPMLREQGVGCPVCGNDPSKCENNG